jgi:hypothetical protein
MAPTRRSVRALKLAAFLDFKDDRRYIILSSMYKQDKNNKMISLCSSLGENNNVWD